MSKNINKLVRAKSNGKQIRSPDQQPKTQTSSQHPPLAIKKDQLPSPSKIKTPQQLSSIESIHLPTNSNRSEMSSSLDGSEVEREELLKMEIKQLKRENQFLKRRIQEMTIEEPAMGKRKKGRGMMKEKEEPQGPA